MPAGRGVLVFNPKAGARDRRSLVAGVVERSGARGLSLEAVATERAGHATELVAARLGERPDLVAVCGGDGTVAEAAQALVGTATPLAILPGGTTNVVAREYGLVPFERAEEALLSPSTRALTAWPVRPSGAPARTSLIGVGVGFDARVMAHVVPALKRLFGRTGIGWTATLEWLKYEFPPIEVTGVDADGNAFARSATAVFSANTKRYGGEPILSPHADASDDLLDLVLFASRSRGDLIRFYHLLSKGKAAHLAMPCVSRLAVRSFTARSLAGYELEVQVDGDFAGRTPVTVGPAAGRVALAVPGDGRKDPGSDNRAA